MQGSVPTFQYACTRHLVNRKQKNKYSSGKRLPHICPFVLLPNKLMRIKLSFRLTLEQLRRILTRIHQSLNLVDYTLTVFGISHTEPLAGFW